MNLSLTEDQRLLSETFAKLFQHESSPERIRAAQPTGFDEALWHQIVELGVPLMRVEEKSGGAGFGLMDATVLIEEAGRHLASVPVIEMLVVGRILADPLNQSGCAKWLEEFANGKAMVSLALFDVATSPRQLISAGAVADAVLCLDGDKLLLATGGDHPLLANVGASPLAHWQLDGSGTGEHIVLQQGIGAVQLFESAVEEWKLLTAVYLGAIGRQALEIAAEYSKEREAFGQLIGSYQGLAHPMADAATEIEGVILLAKGAIWAMAESRPDSAALISMAYWWATQATNRATAKALHVFGGYGLSLEYDIQLYFKRGKAIPLVYGDPNEELDRVAQRLWGDTEVSLPPPGDVSVDFGYGAEADDFAEQTRQFFEATLNDEFKAHAHHSWEGHHPVFQKKLAAAGLLLPDWPEEYGGQGRDRYQMIAMAKVFNQYGWTRNAIAVTDMVGKAILAFGSEQVKNNVLPRFTGGDNICCLGFSEPACGSDVFAAQTRAVKDGDDWIINGQKMFTSGANLADYVLLLTRTDVEVAKHAGLTMFLVPMDSNGLEVQPVETLADEKTNITYYDNVRVSDSYRLGEVNGGITVMAQSLSNEQDGSWFAWDQQKMVNRAVAWAQSHDKGGVPAIELPAIRQLLAETAVNAAVSDVLCRRNLWCSAESLKDRSAGPMSKLFSTESYIRDSSRLMDMMGAESLLCGEDALHHIELDFRLSTATSIYAGSSEIMRSLIAENSLKMPRTRS